MIRFLACALPCLLLAACGYSPLYAPDMAQQISVGRVAMANAENLPGERRVAQQVHQRLKQAFPHAGTHTLNITITESTNDLAVGRDASVERSEVVLKADVSLRANAQTPHTTTLQAAAAYNVEESPFSTESGRQFSRLRAADTLADSILRWVGHTLHNNSNNIDK